MIVKNSCCVTAFNECSSKHYSCLYTTVIIMLASFLPLWLLIATILRLRVPILVRRGRIGLVHLQVPWKSFGSGTLRLILKDMYISLEPIGSCL